MSVPQDCVAVIVFAVRLLPPTSVTIMATMTMKKKSINNLKTSKCMEKKTCCICEKQFEGFGNNPWPVCEFGECCDECNASVVIPARISMSK